VNEPYVIEGYLNLESQEGGYASPAWMVDEQDVSDKLAQHYGIQPDHYIPGKDYTLLPYSPGDIPIGRVRITIERIDDSGRQ